MELDGLSNAAQKRINSSISKTLSAYLKSLSDAGTPPSKARLEKPYLPDIDPAFVRETETFIATALLLGKEHASRKLDMADTVIPSLTFEEAASFMQSRIPVTKREWNRLEPKLRFRAFTVSRLAQLDFIDAARQVLSNAMTSGKGVAETYKQWRILQTLAGGDAMQLRPGYWENVFRTNTQTAYTAGKLMQFTNNPPAAWRLLVVEDDRTSDICKGLLKKGKQSLALAVDDPFWDAFGFPPYHFQCRTGLQAVYKSEIDAGEQIDSTNMQTMRRRFKPMAGFGGNPLDKESWWMMTDGMAKRAAHYNIFNEVEDFAKQNGLYNFAINLVRGKDFIRLQGTNYAARKTVAANPLQKEVAAARVLEDNGHTVFFTSENIRTKNFDAIINGRLGEFKQPASFNKIVTRLNEADRQRASVVCLVSPAGNHTQNQVISKIENWFRSSQRPIQYVDTVLLISGGQVVSIKK